MLKSAKVILNRSREIDRGLERHIEKLSRFIWPWKERWLLVVASSLCCLDFVATYLILVLRNDVYESGLMASRALAIGGFSFLFIADLVAMAVMSLLAFAAKHYYARQGLKNYGRAAFVVILIPYIAVTTLVVINTIIMLLS